MTEKQVRRILMDQCNQAIDKAFSTICDDTACLKIATDELKGNIKKILKGEILFDINIDPYKK